MSDYFFLCHIIIAFWYSFFTAAQATLCAVSSRVASSRRSSFMLILFPGAVKGFLVNLLGMRGENVLNAVG